jgi:hypothetical protein
MKAEIFCFWTWGDDGMDLPVQGWIDLRSEFDQHRQIASRPDAGKAFHSVTAPWAQRL